MLFIIISVITGIGASFATIKLAGEDSQSQPEPATRFYAVNESEIFYGKPVFYRIILENQEGKTIDYEMKVRLSRKEIYNKSIRLSSGSIFNQTISFTFGSGEGRAGSPHAFRLGMKAQPSPYLRSNFKR